MASSDWGKSLKGESLGSLQKRFRGLASPTLDAVHGSYDATQIGPGWLQRMAPVGLALTGFKGWRGKRLGRDGGCSNLFDGPTGVVERLPMTARISDSLLDGKPTIALTYPSGTPWPWLHAVDELRALDGENLLGIVIINLPLLKAFPSPFLLTRVKR